MNYSKPTKASFFMAIGISLTASSFISPLVEAQMAAAKKPAVQLKAGDAFPVDALDDVSWVQGEPVKSLNEPGKIYLIECWATWCGPCIAAIPHVNDLHRKFADKGLVIIGMNVWEDGIEKTQKFVAKKGDGMSYRVAFSGGRKSAFVDKVMKPADITGIPRALVVKDGKLIMNTHPSKIDQAMVSSLIDGSYDPVVFLKKQAQAAKIQSEFIARLRPLQQAKDWAGIKKLAEGLDNDNSTKFSVLLNAAVQSSNWPDLIALRKDTLSGRYKTKYQPSMIDITVARDSKITDGAKTYSDIALADFNQLEENPSPKVAIEHHFTKARMMFISGQTEGAKKELAIAKQWLEKLTEPRSQQFYNAMVLGAIKKVGEGSFPTTTGLMR